MRRSFPYQKVEDLILQDPSNRGVAAFQREQRGFFVNHLEQLATCLVHAESVAIVTGFCIADSNPPAAETDGPLGTFWLAKVFNALGIQPTLISDVFGLPLLSYGCKYWGLPQNFVVACPNQEAWQDQTAWQTWTRWLITTRRISHLIAIERVGPGHDVESITLQSGAASPVVSEFEQQVPLRHRNRCHNMGGRVIDEFTAPLHWLFEFAKSQWPDVVTAGIGDGANEIGFGSLAWQEILHVLPSGTPAWLPCRIPTDFSLIGGTSNWAAIALAAAICWEANRLDALQEMTLDREAVLLSRLVAEAGAVDGFSGQRVPRVDGLSIADYLQPLRQIRQLCGFVD